MKESGYWNNYDNCYQEALKYQTRKAFKKYSGGAFCGAKRNGWLNDYTWMECMQAKKQIRKHNFWNYDSCYNAAKECKTLSEFYTKYAGAYDKAINNNWIVLYSWLDKQFRWTYEKCLSIAKKCNCKRDFIKLNPRAYQASLKYGWIDSFYWFKSPLIKEAKSNGKVYWIYAYIDEENKTCYIGLSRDKARHWRHKQKDKNGKYDSVMSYYISIGKELPNPSVLENNLTAEQAQIKESEYYEYYKNLGYTLLNIQKPGSLGSPIIKWNKEACYEEAKKYISIKEFRESNAAAYRVSRNSGWIKEYTWLKKQKHSWFWNCYENCYNEAKKYTKYSNFVKMSSSAYSSAKRHGWIKDYIWLERTRKKQNPGSLTGVFY